MTGTGFALSCSWQKKSRPWCRAPATPPLSETRGARRRDRGRGGADRPASATELANSGFSRSRPVGRQGLHDVAVDRELSTRIVAGPSSLRVLTFSGDRSAVETWKAARALLFAVVPDESRHRSRRAPWAVLSLLARVASSSVRQPASGLSSLTVRPYFLNIRHDGSHRRTSSCGSTITVAGPSALAARRSAVWAATGPACGGKRQRRERPAPKLGFQMQHRYPRSSDARRRGLP